MTETADTQGEFDLKSFMSLMGEMVKAENRHDELTADCNKGIILEMLRRQDTAGLNKLGHDLLTERAQLHGGENLDAEVAWSFADGFRKNVINEKARRVLVDEVGKKDWMKIETRLPLRYWSADSGVAEIHGVPYVEIAADLEGLDDSAKFIAQFEDRESKNIRVTEAVNDKVNIYVPLDYVMYKEGLGSQESEPVDGVVGEMVQGSGDEISAAYGGKAGE